MLFLLTACNYNKVYDRYLETENEGWEKNEPLVFGIDSLKEGGEYTLALGLRINDRYPFQNLQLIVDQTIFPSQEKVHDIIECKVTDKHGIKLGHGVSVYQYDFPVNRQLLNKGDSISVVVRHNMKREILPGIIDLGVSLKRNNSQ